jgi:hypothetical protein
MVKKACLTMQCDSWNRKKFMWWLKIGWDVSYWLWMAYITYDCLEFWKILTYIRPTISFVIALMYCCLIQYINNLISCHLCKQLGLDNLYEWWWGCRIRKHGFRSSLDASKVQMNTYPKLNNLIEMNYKIECSLIAFDKEILKIKITFFTP